MTCMIVVQVTAVNAAGLRTTVVGAPILISKDM